ncbi:MAG: radical SAM protein [Rhodocyclales bacterium]|nr:radical SAM protein [Rhodocyclales bacterium]
MKVGIISVFMDYHRRGAHHRGVLQPQIGPLIAALLPDDAEIDIVNDTWGDPDWGRDYDLLFLSCLHSDFDRARQIAHYWRRRGAKTVLGGIFASTYPHLCAPYFDAVAVGDPETTVPAICADFRRNRLQPLYVARAYDARATPTPRFDLAARQQILPIALEATRGCPFVCDFCSLTGQGTRYHTRPARDVVRDIRAALAVLRGLTPWHKRNIVAFYDNNLGGSFAHLRELCEALEPLRMYWGVCVTFNVLRNERMLSHLARAGCRGLFVGLESFNPGAIEDMRKGQNVLPEVRQAIARAHRHGIIVMAGLMLSPLMDDLACIGRIPACLQECGLHVPTYISFETPFPGTPHFTRLAGQAEPAFLPNALLRDFNGYTLVTRPRHASPEAFVAAYRQVSGQVFSRGARLRKLALDAASLLPRGHLLPLLYDAFELASESAELADKRSFIAGTDIVPPECGQVPLADADFASARERAAILDPWPVTDAAGRVLPQWQHARRTYLAYGQVAPVISPQVQQPHSNDRPAHTIAGAMS